MNVRDYINDKVLEQSGELASRFQSAAPFRHVMIDDFLVPEFCSEISSQFPDFDPKAAINENGEIGAKATQEKVQSLGSAYQAIDNLVQTPEFLALIEEITGVGNLCYDPYYFGGGTHENRRGQDLDPHVDFNYHPITGQHRRLNLIIYLNEQWEDSWGGSLELHRDPYLEPDADEILTITPMMNRCVIFETNEYSWHGFRRIDPPEEFAHLSRRSFAIYYYTDDRPAEETATEHSTVYVERHLPAEFVPGLELSEDSIRTIRTMLQRRDQHLKRLYSNIQHLHGECNQLRATASLARDPHSRKESQTDGSDVKLSEEYVRQLEARIDEMESSNSWRITAPIRALRRLISG
jgi:Rps23 Pro-64 3,4-dihydroxylase Tpa1-like proline 4-hydroxylase